MSSTTTSSQQAPTSASGQGHESGGAATRLVRRRPLLVFFAWFFTIGQAVAVAPLVLSSAGLDLPRQPFIVASTVIGLLLPALVITRVTEGPDAVRRLLSSAVAWRRPVGWYALALIAVPVSAFLLTAAVSGLPADGGSAVWSAIMLGFILQLVLTTVPNNLWEEVAWTGFVQDRLQRRHSATVAALIVGPLFALQHVSLVVGASIVEAAVLLTLLAILATPFRFVVGWTYNRTGSLFLVGLMHGAGNAAAGGSGFGDGMLPRLYPDSAMATAAHLVVLAVLGLVALIATRGRLGDRRRVAAGE